MQDIVYSAWITCSNEIGDPNMGKHRKKFTRNYKTKYDVGTQHTCSAGPFIILERIKATDENGLKNARAVVRFINTGYVCSIQLSNIPSDRIKDRRLPSVYGVGYLDWDITIPTRDSGSVFRRMYDLWANMLKRCYTNEPGYEDVTVDKRWHSFRAFATTLHRVPGYTAWERDSTLHLDKDVRTGAKVYGIDTCLFLTAHDNLSAASYKRWHGK